MIDKQLLARLQAESEGEILIIQLVHVIAAIDSAGGKMTALIGAVRHVE